MKCLVIIAAALVAAMPFSAARADEQADPVFGIKMPAGYRDWKLVSEGNNGEWELYDLAKDRSETHDLAAKQPDRVRDLAKLWQQHADEFAKQSAADKKD